MKKFILFAIGAAVLALLPGPAGAQVIETVAGGIASPAPAISISLDHATGIAVDGNGNFYIADTNHHIVRRVGTDGNAVTVAGTASPGFSGDGGPATQAQLNAPADVLVDAAGNLFISDSGNSRIRKIDANGIITTIAGDGYQRFFGDNGPATQASLWGPGPIAFDEQGNLFITDAGNIRIRRVGTDGTITTVAGTGISGYAGDGGAATAATFSSPQGLAARGGELFIADMGNNRIRKVSTNGIITTIAGNGGQNYYSSGDGGPALQASINAPTDVAFDSSGNLYVSEYFNRVRKIDTNGIIDAFAGQPDQGFSGDGGPATQAMMSHTYGVAVDALGQVFIADTYNWRIRKVDPYGVITTVAGCGGPYFCGDGGPAVLATLNGPTSVTFDASGNYYITDYYNERIRKVDSSGTITTFTGNGGTSFAGDGGPAEQASIRHPYSTAVDQSGNVYIADMLNQRIRKVGTDGIITTIAGNGTTASTGDGGPATLASLNFPTGVAADAAGNIYIAEHGGNRVRVVRPDGTIDTFAGTGSAGFSGDAGPASQAEINMPIGVAVDAAGNVYIGDRNNARVRKVDASGTITTYAGGGYSGSEGVPATDAQLNGVYGVAVDPAGTLYVTDVWNSRVRSVDTAGIIRTVAGSGAGGFSGDGGPALSASLNSPIGVGVGPAGDLYIADTNNNRVRRLIRLHAGQ
jgi:sugar lactone lactonase YvrE